MGRLGGVEGEVVVVLGLRRRWGIGGEGNGRRLIVVVEGVGIEGGVVGGRISEVVWHFCLTVMFLGPSIGPGLAPPTAHRESYEQDGKTGMVAMQLLISARSWWSSISSCDILGLKLSTHAPNQFHFGFT